MKVLLLIAGALLLNGCAAIVGAGSGLALEPKGPEIVPSAAHQLLNLPPPNTKAVVAVYTFTDKTGQRKTIDNIASFSTAVTQGSDDILIEALRDAGRGNWFAVVERAGLDGLTRERQLIKNTRDMYEGEGANRLKPLLYAGLILEGGIIAYDTNLRTGGAGGRTGEVLLNVTATKTILSTGGGADLFRFYELGTQLVEVESGSTENEAVNHAVRAAIEAAVYGLVIQGLERQVWDFPYEALTEVPDEEAS